MNKPDFTKPRFNLSKDFRVRISQVPPMDVAFQSMGLTEYELLVATIYKLNELISQTNSYTELIDEILKWVLNEGLEQTLVDQLNVWLNDGTLETMINEVLFNMKLDKTEFEDYKVLVVETLTTLENNLILEINKKADKTYVDVELIKKADKTYVDNGLNNKADKTYVDVELGKKADKTYVDVNLNLKADKTTVSTISGQISNLVANAGNTDGNAELLDIRVGWDGITYATAGESVRSIQQFMTENDEEWSVV